jgi:transcriptional antiterminator Rof (Rho-off)
MTPFTSNIKYNIILFETLPSLNSDKVNNAQPYTTWAMFQDNKAIAFGVGEEKDAEHSIYSALVNQKYASGKLKQSQAERMIFDNFRKIYGEPEPITKEMAMFRIMLAEKMETGKVLQAEADYLMAQKEAEVAERIKEIQRKEEQLLKEDAARRELIELQQRQLVNQQQANAIAQSHATSQALLGVANYINQQTYQQQLLQSLNKPFSMNCWSNGNYTNCRQQ